MMKMNNNILNIEKNCKKAERYARLSEILCVSTILLNIIVNLDKILSFLKFLLSCLGL